MLDHTFYMTKLPMRAGSEIGENFPVTLDFTCMVCVTHIMMS